MLQSIIIPFITIFLAEFFDKSQLALLLLSTKTRRHMQLLLGALLAFALVDGAAILFGSFVTSLFPPLLIKLVAAATFFYFGVTTFRAGDKEQATKPKSTSAFFSAFTAIFISELGDKTQIASAVFATQFAPLLVFLGVMGAMLLLAIVAIYLGRFIGKNIQAKTIHRVAGILFLIIGVGFLVF